MVEMELDDALHTIGFGKAHVYLLLSCSFLSLASMNEAMGMSIIVVVSQCDLETTNGQKSLMTSAALIGMSSAFYLGYQADINGRRRILLICLFGTCVCCIISIFMPNVYLLVIMRFAGGLFIAGPASLNVAYISEFCPSDWRPTMANLVSYNVGFSFIYCPLVARFFLSFNIKVTVADAYVLRSWRFLILLYALPALCGFVTFIFLPESPCYLLSVQRNEEALAVLSWLCRKNRHKDLEELDITQLKEFPRTSLMKDTNFLRHIWDDNVHLVRWPYRKYFFITISLMFGTFLTAIGLALWFPLLRSQYTTAERTLCEVLNNATGLEAQVNLNNSNSTKEKVVCDDKLSNYMDPTMLGIAYIIGYTCIIAFLRFLSRKTVIFLFYFSATICGLLLNILHNPTVIIVCFIGLIVLPGVMMSLVSTVLVDCVPTQLRGKALCLVRAVARLGAVLGSFIIGLLLRVSCILTINIFVVSMFLCVVLTFFPPS